MIFQCPDPFKCDCMSTTRSELLGLARECILELFKNGKVSTQMQQSQLFVFSLYSIVIRSPDPCTSSSLNLFWSNLTSILAKMEWTSKCKRLHCFYPYFQKFSGGGPPYRPLQTAFGAFGTDLNAHEIVPHWTYFCQIWPPFCLRWDRPQNARTFFGQIWPPFWLRWNEPQNARDCIVFTLIFKNFLGEDPHTALCRLPLVHLEQTSMHMRLYHIEPIFVKFDLHFA